MSETSEPRGRIEVLCGCMFAGKTGELIRRLRGARETGLRVRAFKHVSDRRFGSETLCTHDGVEYEARVAAFPADLFAETDASEVIGIDEAQFFGPALTEVCQALRARGVRIIAAGIDHDAWGRPFPPMPQLKRCADEVLVLSAPCTRCGATARFSQRVSRIVGGDMVGGKGEYEPRCGRCFEPLTISAPVG